MSNGSVCADPTTRPLVLRKVDDAEPGRVCSRGGERVLHPKFTPNPIDGLSYPPKAMGRESYIYAAFVGQREVEAVHAGTAPRRGDQDLAEAVLGPGRFERWLGLCDSRQADHDSKRGHDGNRRQTSQDFPPHSRRWTVRDDEARRPPWSDRPAEAPATSLERRPRTPPPGWTAGATGRNKARPAPRIGGVNDLAPLALGIGICGTTSPAAGTIRTCSPAGGPMRFRPSGAAQESNLPTVGLQRPAGFEDRMGHRARAAPGASSVVAPGSVHSQPLAAAIATQRTERRHDLNAGATR